MPPKELSKSMKAKLYDFTYSPFMSSMVISWIILNHKYILIYMASIKDFNEKLDLLDNFDFSLWGIPYMHNAILPILFGLFYTFIYPQISKVFYKYTLNRSKELKTIKKDIEDETPITNKESKYLKNENYEKSEKILELEEKLSTIRNEYEVKLSSLEKESIDKITNNLNTKHQKAIKDITSNFEEQLKRKKENLNQKYQNIIKERDELIQHIAVLKTKNSQLNDENRKLLKELPQDISKIKIDKDDKSEILQYFYNSNYKPTTLETVLDNIVENTKIPRPRVSSIINQLIKEKNFSIKVGNTLHITDQGNNLLVEKFYNGK